MGSHQVRRGWREECDIRGEIVAFDLATLAFRSQSVKHKHWRGLHGTNARKPAPMLELDDLIISHCHFEPSSIA